MRQTSPVHHPVRDGLTGTMPASVRAVIGSSGGRQSCRAITEFGADTASVL